VSVQDTLGAKMQTNGSTVFRISGERTLSGEHHGPVLNCAAHMDMQT
jgi:hypothetical protein